MFRAWKVVRNELIPGTLNVGQSIMLLQLLGLAPGGGTAIAQS